ncbi:hypothetical protein [uncultured Duncaniella sp.]|uniref:hypothetical protein n=1 Tax=uncultured Duncaniella sp. TaxID=2768039 RepID=UPI002647C03F|nr:hypothetical protein [uncultured Duncaniella sp.]
MSTTLFHNAILVNEGESVRGWILVEGDKIARIGHGDTPADLQGKADTITDCEGAYIIPGVIDTHVHFRDPGLQRKPISPPRAVPQSQAGSHRLSICPTPIRLRSLPTPCAAKSSAPRRCQ